MVDMERVLSGCLLVVGGGRRLRRKESKTWRRTGRMLLAISGEIECVGVGATVKTEGELFEAEVAWSEFERRAEGEGEEGR
jgi:hypothetical protein